MFVLPAEVENVKYRTKIVERTWELLENACDNLCIAKE